jgi:molybdenum cofactor synthesis domain-containing protein
MKMVRAQEALGAILCHDLTEIVPGGFKGPAFRKGHILREEDIPRLLDMGKEHIFVWEAAAGLLHENEATLRLGRAAAGPGIELTEPGEGRIHLKAAADGLLEIDLEGLQALNADEQVSFATLHTNQRVVKGKIVAGAHIIPLAIEEARIGKIEEMRRNRPPVVQIKPLRSLRVGIVTTGSEVFSGRIKDRFGPVVVGKVEEAGCRVIGQTLVSDRVDLVSGAIEAFLNEGAELIAVTGGMSVDPDDVTPAGIRAAGGRIVTYGAPMLPGAMFMLAYIGSVPVLGLPGCVMYHKASIFDVVLPRILAGKEMTRQDFVKLAHGGLCAHCEPCGYPNCGFGKGA